MKKIKRILFFFIYHFIISIWNIYIFKIKLLTEYIKFNLKNDENYMIFDNIKNLDQLNNWIKHIYRYNNSLIKDKIFKSYNDAVLYFNLKLKQLGYKTKIIVIFKNECLCNWHCECLFSSYDDNIYLLNYGNNIKGKSEEECLVNFNNKYNKVFDSNLTWIKSYKCLEYLGGMLTILFVLLVIALIFFL